MVDTHARIAHPTALEGRRAVDVKTTIGSRFTADAVVLAYRCFGYPVASEGKVPHGTYPQDRPFSPNIAERSALRPQGKLSV